MTSELKPFEISRNVDTKKQTGSNLVSSACLLARRDTEKKAGPCSRFCSYRSFGPVLDLTYYWKHHDFWLFDVKSSKKEHVEKFYRC